MGCAGGTQNYCAFSLELERSLFDVSTCRKFGEFSCSALVAFFVGYGPFLSRFGYSFLELCSFRILDTLSYGFFVL